MLNWYRETGAIFAAVDAPQNAAPMAVPPVDVVTRSDLAYFRALGRDAKNRMEYRYSDEELQELAGRIRTLEADHVMVAFANGAYALEAATKLGRGLAPLGWARGDGRSPRSVGEDRLARARPRRYRRADRAQRLVAMRAELECGPERDVDAHARPDLGGSSSSPFERHISPRPDRKNQTSSTVRCRTATDVLPAPSSKWAIPPPLTPSSTRTFEPSGATTSARWEVGSSASVEDD